MSEGLTLKKYMPIKPVHTMLQIHAINKWLCYVIICWKMLIWQSFWILAAIWGQQKFFSDIWKIYLD